MPKNPDSTTVGLQAHIHHDGATATLVLSGEFDLAEAEAVRERFAEARADAPERIVIDLRQLTFIDSTGIAFLVSAVRDDEEGRLSFIPCDAPEVQRVFAITGVTELFGGGNGGSGTTLS